MMSNRPMERPYYPIIYVRGYAGNEEAVEETVADPYMGFNVGSTKIRQHWEKGEVQKFFFESPLVRLMKDEDLQYRDVYHGGDNMPLDRDISQRSIIIYRYYDQVSSEVGTGDRPEIEHYAEGLSKLILELRDRLCDDDAQRNAFRVYLVAHSMGGLICRCFLQNPAIGDADAKGAVDKVFTYATPHNGIDLRVIGNVPGFFSRNNVNHFNRDRMKDYLALPNATDEDVRSLGGQFDPDRFFCLVGTNHKDYTVASGWSRRVVGPMSDGLVRISNAVVYGTKPGEQRNRHSPRAFVYRSHSGHYGIVNSEDGYQNLIRFLFGDVRVDCVLEVENLTLPRKVQEKYDAGKKIRASYHFEVVTRVRGARWDMHRRTTSEGSAIFRTFDEMLRPQAGQRSRHPFLFSAFLARSRKVAARRKSLGFSVDLAVQVPEYEVDNRIWFDDHYDGGYLYRDKINLEAIPPSGDRGWRLKYGFDSRTPNQTSRETDAIQRDDGIEFRIPIRQNTRPGIEGTLALVARPWE